MTAVGHNSHEAGVASAAYLLDRRDRPTAIACVSDVLALGAIEAIAPRGLRVGHDISLTGFDDVPAALPPASPRCASPSPRRAGSLGRMLLDPEYTERRVVLPTELVVRSSTGPAPTPQTR